MLIWHNERHIYHNRWGKSTRNNAKNNYVKYVCTKQKEEISEIPSIIILICLLKTIYSCKRHRGAKFIARCSAWEDKASLYDMDIVERKITEESRVRWIDNRNFRKSFSRDSQHLGCVCIRANAHAYACAVLFDTDKRRGCYRGSIVRRIKCAMFSKCYIYTSCKYLNVKRKKEPHRAHVTQITSNAVAPTR